MGLKRYIFGNNRERMADISFRIMSASFRLMDFFRHPEKQLVNFGIREGFTIIDYGCGPGRYVKEAAKLVGGRGKVYAVDIQRLAIESVKKKIEKYNLKNVQPVLADGYSCAIEDRAAEMIYVLDTFHMIERPSLFLKELHRLLRQDGFLIIDDGHQSRNQTKEKINHSYLWRISEESKSYLTCIPVYS